MLLKYLLVTICCFQLTPIKAFIFNIENAINMFSNFDNTLSKSDNTYSKHQQLTTNQNTINERNLLCDQQFSLFVDGLENRVEWAVSSKIIDPIALVFNKF
jgi:hypothetical protein